MAETVVELDEIDDGLGAEQDGGEQRPTPKSNWEGIAGLKLAGEHSGKVHLATRHMVLMTGLLLLTLAATPWLVGAAEDQMAGLADGAEVTVLDASLGWVLIFVVAFAGALLNRMVALSFVAFRYKSYDPLTFPNDMVLAARAPFVALALFGLVGDQLLLGDGGAGLSLLAVAFTLGYFGDMAFEKLRDIVRTLLGKEIDSDQPELPLLGGVDIPLKLLPMAAGALGKVLKSTDVETLVEELNEEGIEYAHEFLALARTKDGRETLREAATISEHDLERLREVLDVTRTGATVGEAVALVLAGVTSAGAVAGMDPSTLLDDGDGGGVGDGGLALSVRDAAAAGDPVQTRAQHLRRNADQILEPF